MKRGGANGQITLSSRIGPALGDAFIAEDGQVERAVSAVDDQLGDARPTPGACCRPCPEKPLA